MLIYLDTRDIIELEKGNPCDIREFGCILARGGHELVLSTGVVLEFSEPLLETNRRVRSDTVVTRLLNQLDGVPRRFIVEWRIIPEELQNAWTAFASKTEYQAVDPFVERFDYALDNAATRPLVGLSLSEIIWRLKDHQPEIWKTHKGKTGARFRSMIERDRGLGKRRQLADHFPVTVARDLKQDGITPPDNLEEFAGWIYADPSRCPGKRLAFEIYHLIRQNRSDRVRGNDLADFTHVECLPYVDAATLERRFKGYVEQASGRLNIDYGKRLYPNVADLLKHI